MPVCPTTFTKWFVYHSQGKKGGQSFTLVPRFLPAPVIPHMILLLPENSAPWTHNPEIRA